MEAIVYIFIPVLCLGTKDDSEPQTQAEDENPPDDDVSKPECMEMSSVFPDNNQNNNKYSLYSCYEDTKL